MKSKTRVIIYPVKRKIPTRRKTMNNIFVSFLKKRNEKGQVLVIFAIAFVLLLVVAGVLVDAAFFLANKIIANENAAVACIVAAEAHRRGESADAAFASILNENEMLPETYSPKEGSGFDLTKGLENHGDGSWLSAVFWEEPTHFLGLVGFHKMGISGRARCVERDNGGLSPIAVRRSAIEDSINGLPPEEYTILGRDPAWDLADEESGTNFRGAVFFHMWCVPATDPNCPNVRVFYPLTEEPPSAQTQKKLVMDCFMGINCNIWPDVGQRLPIVSGTSNNQLCKAFQDGGWKVGDKTVVIVFNGTVYDPNPTFGNWENVAIVGYAVFEIVSFEPNPNNCNHVIARLYSNQIYTSMDDIPADVILLKSREISWDYGGPIPWK